jgi:hypothetical protein
LTLKIASVQRCVESSTSSSKTEQAADVRLDDRSHDIHVRASCATAPWFVNLVRLAQRA